MSARITDIITTGPVHYRHHYLTTMTGEEIAEHRLDAPAALKALAARHPDAILIEYGDGSLGIESAGRLLAVELPHSEYRPGPALPREVWQYLTIATGGNGDTRAGAR